MGTVVLGSLAISTLVILHYCLLPVETVWTGAMDLTLIAFTMIWGMSVIGLFVWLDDVRKFYRDKNDPLAMAIKIITFPIWIIGFVLFAWGSYETAKGVRNWMNKKD
jgi:hypothetical protein